MLVAGLIREQDTKALPYVPLSSFTKTPYIPSVVSVADVLEISIS